MGLEQIVLGRGRQTRPTQDVQGAKPLFALDDLRDPTENEP